MPSRLLVTLQFVLIGALVVSSRPLATDASNVAAAAFLAAGVAIGLAAVAVNRPSNFNIRPELRAGAQLVTRGIYRCVRHPMYLSVMLLMAAALAVDPRPWRFALWATLLAVLLAKLVREERYLTSAFPAYAKYATRTARLLPGIY